MAVQALSVRRVNSRRGSDSLMAPSTVKETHVRHPGRLELIDPQLVALIEREPGALVWLHDDLRQVLQPRLGPALVAAVADSPTSRR
jgi:hypothetical protein